MDLSGCANCFMHGWKQVEDQSILQRCKRCKLIQYCGRECQAEHWKRIHKKQCRYFTDPDKAQKWGHNEEACSICLQAAQVGKDELTRPINPNYECILKETFPSNMYHPHPFPVAGLPGNTYEKVIIVLWQLLKKLELTQPGVISNCQGKLVQVYAELKMIRLEIWAVRKISPQNEWRLKKVHPESLVDLLNNIREKVGIDDFMDDLFLIIMLVDGMLLDVYFCELLQILLNPLADIPADLYGIVSQAVSNSAKFLAMANQVLNALSSKVVPYNDLLRIVCGGSQNKRCTFCSVKITIATMGRMCGKVAGVLFNCLLMEIYCCGSPNCLGKANSMMEEYNQKFVTAVMATARSRESTQCDFCLKLPPSEGGHRCSKCLSVMYCSVTCRDQDREIHKEFCKEEVEERKKKFGSSERRKEARFVAERLEKGMEEALVEELKKGTKNVKLVQGAYQAASKFKDATKKAKK